MPLVLVPRSSFCNDFFDVGSLSASSSVILFVPVIFDVSAISASSSEIFFCTEFYLLLVLLVLVPRRFLL